MTRITRSFAAAPRRWLAGATAAAVLVLAACGGGADGGIGGTGGGGGGGIGGTGVAYGAITGFGSVWVNGVRYDTGSASFRRDDDSVSQSDLRIGMVARIEGSATAGTASLVSVRSALKGRVEAVSGGTYTVMGQSVRTDAGTLFDNGVQPAAGDLVEVHGLPEPGSVIAATYVERRNAPASPPFAVTGFVTAHDMAASTFTIGSLTVRYAGAATGDMPAGSWVGRVVEARGGTCAGSPVCGTLTASRVEPSGPRIDSSPKAEVEGFVSALTADGFMMGAQRVVVTAGTAFEDGAAADLVVGAKVEAEGPISGGVLTATKIELKAGARIEADVATRVGDRITLAGLPGIEVQLTPRTELSDLGSLADVVPGLHVRLRGRPVGPALIVATELDGRPARTDVELRGRATSATDPLITVLGVTIDTTGLPDSAFRRDDSVIGRTAFFTALASGHAVQAKGDRSGNSVVWRELELED